MTSPAQTIYKVLRNELTVATDNYRQSNKALQEMSPDAIKSLYKRYAKYGCTFAEIVEEYKSQVEDIEAALAWLDELIRLAKKP